MSQERQRKICDICGGTGQVSFFQGVSRFLLSTTECEECAGTGFQLNSAPENSKEHNAGKQRKNGMKQNKK
jgi:DnaJ-class molecular chaperone